MTQENTVENTNTSMRIEQVFQNTFEAITDSEQSGDDSPYAYHKFVKGFCRFDGKTNRGSFILELTDWAETMEFLQSLNWTEMSQAEARADGDSAADTSVSQYFRATIPEGLNGFQAGNIFKNLSADAQEKVVEIDGYHGPELVLKNGSIADFLKTNEIRLIVSRSSHPYNKTGKDIMATWFPGVLAPPNALLSGRKHTSRADRFVKVEL